MPLRSAYAELDARGVDGFASNFLEMQDGPERQIMIQLMCNFFTQMLPDRKKHWTKILKREGGVASTSAAKRRTA